MTDWESIARIYEKYLKPKDGKEKIFITTTMSDPLERIRIYTIEKLNEQERKQ